MSRRLKGSYVETCSCDLIRERDASAIVRSDATGWNMPAKRTGSPVSTPNGTMSSISNAFGIEYEGKTGLSTSEFSWAA